MSKIDYSKWDKLTYEDSSSSDDEAQTRGSAAGGRPRVTRLDQPSKVTRTAQGQIIIEEDGTQRGTTSRCIESVTSVGTQVDSQRSENSTKSQGLAMKPSAPGPDKKSGIEIPQSWTDKGGECETTSEGTKICWSQDRSTVTIRLLLPQSASKSDEKHIVKGWSCNVSNLLPYDRRHSAVGSSDQPRLRVFRSSEPRDRVVLVEGDLPHPVYSNEYESDVDWTIESYGLDKYMTVVLNKATPMQGLTLWWKRPLLDCSEIHIDWDRGGSSEAFVKAWNEAHEQFREKRASGNVGVEL